MPAETVDILDRVEVCDLVEVEELAAFFFEGELVVDRFRRDVRVVQKLRGAEKEREELVIVQSPDAVRAGGLEIICGLDPAHEREVRGKYDEY